MEINGNFLLDLLYPARCPFCGEIRPFGELLVCGGCLKGLKRVAPPYCMRCGKTVDSEETEYCGDCERIPKSYERGFPAFVYQGAVKTAIYDFKYKNQRSYGALFARFICLFYEEQIKALRIDGIVPVPVHRRKKRLRGCNQAEVLAKQMGRRLRIPVFPDYLVRTEDTSPQKELDDRARIKNLKNAFKMGENKIKLSKVLLVDDIYTTGATVEACTRVMLSGGTEKVYYASLAIGKGYSE
ncbi:MAG: ComF family protein [Bacteroidales bacterium]|nr:ComF family protein [Clostridium sp.]MCM1203821.1 ComF family protein [Bacteroidales bacterium]